MRQPSFEKTQHSQRISRAAVPNKRSSPPAVKCGVCIGVTQLSQAEMAEKSTIRGLSAPYLTCTARTVPCYVYWDVTPVSLITRRYFELSLWTKSLNWATDMGVTTAPAASRRALTSGSS